VNRAQRRVTVAAQGRRYVLGCTNEFDGIWRKRPWGWRLVSRYPLSDDGWRVASAQFTDWEPSAGTAGRGVVLRDERLAPRERRLPTWGWVVMALVVAGAGATVEARMRWNPLSAGPGTRATAATMPFAGPGYIATGANFVDYVQWHDVRGQLTGVAQVVRTVGHAPGLSAVTSTLSVTGGLHDATISLSFAGSPPTFGALSGGSFTVDFPQSDGTVGPVTFVDSSATQYTRAVATLDGQLARANQVVASAQNVQHERHKLSADITTVGADIRRVSNLSALTAAVEAVTAAAQQVNVDLSHVQADLDKAEAQPASTGVGQVCPAAAQVVASDAQQLVNDASNGVEYRATQGVESQIGALRGGVGSLQSDFAQLQADQSYLPGPPSSTGPTQRQVTQTAVGADNAITAAVSATNSSIDQANSVVTAAYAYVTQVFQVAGCGASPPAPPALQDIG